MEGVGYEEAMQGVVECSHNLKSRLLSCPNNMDLTEMGRELSSLGKYVQVLEISGEVDAEKGIRLSDIVSLLRNKFSYIDHLVYDQCAYEDWLFTQQHRDAG